MTDSKRITILTICALSFFILSSKEIFAMSDYNHLYNVKIKPGYNEEAGIKVLFGERVTKTEIAGKKCVATNRRKKNNFINFDVDDSFIFNGEPDEVILTVEYLDKGKDSFAIQYDSTCFRPYDEAFMRAGKRIRKQDTGEWKTYTIRARKVRFANRQGYGRASLAFLKEGGGDFRINARGDGDEYISNVEVRIPYITVAVNEAGNIFEDKKNINILVNVNNRGKGPVSYTLEYDITDLSGKIMQSKKDGINILKNSILPYNLKTQVDKKGVFFAYIRLRDDNNIIEEYKTSFAVCDAPISYSSLFAPFGVAVILQRGEIGKTLKVLKRLNIKWVRQGLRWEYVETRKGKFNWKITDIIINECYENGINICALLLGSNISDPRTGSVEAIMGFSNFVSKLTSRYKEKIKYWQVWNEPDLRGAWPGGPNAENYTKLLKACYAVIKKADPSSQVMTAGLVGGKRNNFWFLTSIYENIGKGHFDIVAIHPYTGSDPPEKDNALENKLKSVMNRLFRAGDAHKKIYISEIGWSTSTGSDKRNVSLTDQAGFLVRSYIIALSKPNVKRIFWHCFRNYGMEPKAHQQHYGLINNDFTPKPAAIAYLNMINQIGRLRYVGRLDLEAPFRGYVFGNKNRKTWVLWSSGAPKVLKLPINDKFALLTDIMGNMNQIEAKEGKITLLLTENPVFLERN